MDNDGDGNGNDNDGGKKCLMECNERFLLSRTKEFIVLYDDTR